MQQNLNKQKNGLEKLIRNIPLLISTIAALCLFSAPSIIFLILDVLIFAVVVAMVMQSKIEMPHIPKNKVMIFVRLVVTLVVVLLGYSTFAEYTEEFLEIDSIKIVLNAFEFLSYQTIILLPCLISFFAIYKLSGWIMGIAYESLIKNLPKKNTSAMCINLKKNWWFLFSVGAFFALNVPNSKIYLISGIVGFAICIAIVSQVSSVWKFIKKQDKLLITASALSAAGFCIGGYKKFCEASGSYQQILFLLQIIGIILAVISFICVFVYMLFVLSKIKSIFTETGLFCDIKLCETFIYAAIVLITIIFTVVLFMKSYVFYGLSDLSDFGAMYSGDSFALVRNRVYISLRDVENDLRQPLFAVFAAPFLGIPYLLGYIFSLPESIAAILLNAVQIVIMFIANFILTKIMKLSSIKRVCFMIITSCTYTYMLFSLMMEQYIIVYFWLVLCVYFVCNAKSRDYFTLYGAGGTLLTSSVLLPFFADFTSVKDWKNIILECKEYIVRFIFILLAFGRLDLFATTTANIYKLCSFTGESISMIDKLKQYFAFIKNYFAVPDAGIILSNTGKYMWVLNPINDIELIGVIILAIAVISAIWNKNKKSSILALYWIVFSFVMLVLLGWGTKENCLTLYSLYFGWAFLMLIFQFVEKLESCLKTKLLIPCLTVICTIVFLRANIPAIKDLVDFAITYYPL